MKRTSVEELQSVLEIEGVNAKGYGIVSQAVMFDPDLPIESKAIYAYFCSYLGSGRSIFPMRETILSDLKISKNAYYKAFKPILDLGYIKISKAKGFKNKNIYTIRNNPSRVNCRPTASSGKAESLLSMDGINANGYGIVPRLIMSDHRLSIKAKALVAFFYSLAQSGSCSFPHRETICSVLSISKNTYYVLLNQLISCDYITLKQRRVRSGRFSVNDYILNSNPKAEPPSEEENNSEDIKIVELPCPKNEDILENEENTTVSPCPKNEDIINNRVPKIETFPCLKNRDNNNITSNKNSSTITSSIPFTSILYYTDNAEKIRDMIYELSDYENVKKEFEDCKQSDNRTLRSFAVGMKYYLQFVNTLIEMLRTKTANYKSDTVTAKDVFNALELCTIDGSIKDMLTEATYHFETITEKYNIHNPYAYSKTLLWQHIKNYPLGINGWWQSEE